jgi:hypothetical protein
MNHRARDVIVPPQFVGPRLGAATFEFPALSATVDPAGETRTYPCISWCSAEQKSVQ